MNEENISVDEMAVDKMTLDEMPCCHNGTVRIRHQCRKTTVLSCHRCLINTGVEKMNFIKILI